MKTLSALPLLLLSLFAFASPAKAQELRFEKAEIQLQEVLEQFGFDKYELTENSETCVNYLVEHEGFIFHLSYLSEGRLVCYATWVNDRGVRRDTLQQANDWNCSSWTSRAILMSDGRWKLFTTVPREASLSIENAVDLIDSFLIDKDRFIETF